jgi:hypothetical protein
VTVRPPAAAVCGMGESDPEAAPEFEALLLEPLAGGAVVWEPWGGVVWEPAAGDVTVGVDMMDGRGGGRGRRRRGCQRTAHSARVRQQPSRRTATVGNSFPLLVMSKTGEKDDQSHDLVTLLQLWAVDSQDVTDLCSPRLS